MWKSVVESSWNVMAHGDTREGKWRGNWRFEWVASTLHTTSEHGVLLLLNAHASSASSRLNWRPRRFKWTRPFRRKTKSGFCACAITFQTQSTSRQDTDGDIIRLMRTGYWITKATHTHILRICNKGLLIAFLQQWLPERLSCSLQLLFQTLFADMYTEYRFEHLYVIWGSVLLINRQKQRWRSEITAAKVSYLTCRRRHASQGLPVVLLWKQPNVLRMAFSVLYGVT
jgi:hypothetical protein